MPAETKTKNYSTAEVAELAGVHRDTLLRWLRQKQIPEPSRNRHGWRFFTREEADGIRHFRERLAPYSPVPDHAMGLERLKAIDWNFSDAKTDYLTHFLHPYPAKFIPQIPNALIQELSSVGDTVADIFCGSGTTLVEALTLKRNAVGIDANPLACLIAKAKTTRFSPQDEESLAELVGRAERLSNMLDVRGEPLLFNNSPFRSAAPRPDHKAITFWFEPFVIEELAEILSWCRDLPTQESKDVAFTIFSSIVVAVSRQDSDTRYVRRDKKIHPGDVFKRFARNLASAILGVSELSRLVEPRFSCSIHQKNLLDRPDIGPVDLVVCSPPYPNAYSYHLYHMTRMVWLGMDQPRFKKEEIGSHRKYSNRGPNGATVETFRGEMSQIFSWMRAHLKDNGYACFVIGDSTIKGKKISNVDLLADLALGVGFSVVSRIDRRIQDVKKAFNPAIGKIKDEQVLILRKKQ